jgi:hypothetical protein
VSSGLQKYFSDSVYEIWTTCFCIQGKNLKANILSILYK